MARASQQVQLTDALSAADSASYEQENVHAYAEFL